jgi:hypothetical protein
MAGHSLVFRPLALRQRAGFVNSKHKAALAALDKLDNLTCRHPEDGIETAAKGRFVLNVGVAVHPETFICAVVYSYNRQTVSWEAFTWKTAAAR